MHPHQTSPCERSLPCDCEPGDWVALSVVEDWPMDCGHYAYVLPGQVMVQPMQQMPATAPMLCWHFRRESRTTAEGARQVVWVRES